MKKQIEESEFPQGFNQAMATLRMALDQIEKLPESDPGELGDMIVRAIPEKLHPAKAPSAIAFAWEVSRPIHEIKSDSLYDMIYRAKDLEIFKLLRMCETMTLCIKILKNEIGLIEEDKRVHADNLSEDCEWLQRGLINELEERVHHYRSQIKNLTKKEKVTHGS